MVVRRQGQQACHGQSGLLHCLLCISATAACTCMALYVGQPKDYEGPEMIEEDSLLHATKVDSSILKEVEQTLAACIIPAWPLSRLPNSLEVWPLKQESVDAVLRGLLCPLQGILHDHLGQVLQCCWHSLHRVTSSAAHALDLLHITHKPCVYA